VCVAAALVFGCLCVCCSLISASGSVWSERAVSLCRCVAVCGTALHWTVAAAVSSSSRAAAVALLGSLTSGCGAVS
jgi:hypothetical protein